MTPKAQATKAKIKKWDHIKLQSFCKATNNELKRQPTKWEKMLANSIGGEELIPKISEDLL